MKYKVGDRVKYRYNESREEVCPTCGHEEYVYSEHKGFGLITKVKMEKFFHLANGFITTDEIVEEDGKQVHNPYMNPIGITESKEEPVYQIGEKWLTEDKISGVL